MIWLTDPRSLSDQKQIQRSSKCLLKFTYRFYLEVPMSRQMKKSVRTQTSSSDRPDNL